MMENIEKQEVYQIGDKNMLFVNLDLILELLNTNCLKKCSENKLKYYDLICESCLHDDLKITSRERKIIESFIKNNPVDIASSEQEKTLFTKLIVSDYLLRIGCFSEVDLDYNQDLVKLFDKYASSELKNDKEFATVILELDGRYIRYMGEKIRNNRTLMVIAIANDSTESIESFTKTDTQLKHDSEIALEFFQKMKSNQESNFSVEEVYNNIFKKDDNAFSTVIFKEDEQSSWLSNPEFLPSLVRIDRRFNNYVVDGRISKKVDNKGICKIKN